MTVDYARMNYHWQMHHARFVRRVKQQRPRLVCQDCKGRGGEVDVIFDGQGPFENCGWCEGTGLLIPWLRSLWLCWKRTEKRKRKPLSVVATRTEPGV